MSCSWTALCAFEEGKVFHLMAAQPFAHDQLLTYISKVTGWPFVEVTVSKVVNWELSIAKARAMLGYNPTRDVFQMVDEGWALRSEGKTP